MERSKAEPRVEIHNSFVIPDTRGYPLLYVDSPTKQDEKMRRIFLWFLSLLVHENKIQYIKKIKQVNQPNQKRTINIQEERKKIEIKRMKQNNNNNIKILGEYDYVIIGGGTAAMGLLNGLLEQQQPQQQQQNINNPNDCKKNVLPYTIAVIERGAGYSSSSIVDDATSTTDQTTSCKKINYTNKLCDWTKASQWMNSLSTTLYTGRINISSWTTCTDGNFNYQCTSTNTNDNNMHRCIDVCVGRHGLGGTTNINAGLLVPPSISITRVQEQEQQQQQQLNNTNKNEKFDCYNDDFVLWPRMIQNEMNHSIQCLLNTMDNNNCIGYTVSSTSSSLTQQQENEEPSISFSEQYRSTNHNNRWWDTSVRISNNYNNNNSTQASSEEDEYTEDCQQQNQQKRTMCYNVPCCVSTKTMQRRNFYDSLVAPILRKQQQQQQQHQQQYDDIQTNNNIQHNDMIQFYTNYTAQHLLFDTTTTTTNISRSSTPTCIGTEVLCHVTGQYCTLLARKDVIVCAGTIETPILLLLSGIGRHIDLHNIYSNSNNQQQQDDDDDEPSGHGTRNSSYIVSDQYKGYVGGNLHDHILVPRIYWHLNQYKELSLNCVRSISNITILKKKNKNIECTSSTGANIQNVNTVSSNNKESYRIIRGQYVLTDATAATEIIPLVTAAIVRYLYPNMKIRTTATKYYANVAMNIILHWVYYFVRTLLTIIVRYTPVYYLVRYCISVVLVAMTNCQSTGTINIRRKQQCRSSSPSTDSTGSAKIQPILPLRREHVDVDINLGYFSNQRDKEAFVDIWNGSTDTFPELTTTCGSNAFEIFPRIKTNDTFLIHYGQRFALSFFHYVGTCRMKRHHEVEQHEQVQENHLNNHHINSNDNDHDDWVVDENFRVREIKSLRICDASVFPTHISSPTALTCAALGHILAKQIVGEYKEK